MPSLMLLQEQSSGPLRTEAPASAANSRNGVDVLQQSPACVQASDTARHADRWGSLDQTHTAAEALEVERPTRGIATCMAALPTAAAADMQAAAAAAPLQGAQTHRHKPLHHHLHNQPQLKLLPVLQSALNSPSHSSKRLATPREARKALEPSAVSSSSECKSSS